MRSCTRPRFRGLLGRSGLLLMVTALSACDIPTELPLIDVRWVVPIDDQSISVVELLPANVDTAGGNFGVTVAPYSVTETLGGLCAACAILNGQTVPKPAFNITFNDTGSLPADVVSVEMVSGSVSMGIQNSLGFDPIRPAVAGPGTMTMTFYDADASGRVLGQLALDGATDSLPDGSLTTVPLNLTAGTVTPTIFTEVVLDSPLGDTNVLINTANGLDIAVTVNSIVVSSVTVNVDGLSVDIDPTDLDVEDIDADVVENVQSGSLILDVQNPFGVAIDVVIEIGGPGITTIQKNLSIGSGATTSATLAYTGPELQSFLGQAGVFFRGSGMVVSPGTPATVSATDVASIEASLDLQLRIGS